VTGARKIQAIPTRLHARLLQATLVNHRWTHQQLADALGVTRATVSRWLSEDREPSQISMKVIRSVYEQSVM
jgi:transcriptional regulator with XRE-family HTH domain